MKKIFLFILIINYSAILYCQEIQKDSSEIEDNEQFDSNQLKYDSITNENSLILHPKDTLKTIESIAFDSNILIDSSQSDKHIQYKRLANNLLLLELFNTKNEKIDEGLHYIGIDNSSKFALARNESTLFIIDLIDGQILYTSKFERLRKYRFSENSDYLYFCDNNKFFEIELKNMKKTMLFEIQSEHLMFDPSAENLFFDDGFIYYSLKDKISSSGYHYYNIYKFKKNQDSALTFVLKFDSLYKHHENLVKGFNFFKGKTNEKIFKLKILYGDDLVISTLENNQHILIYKENLNPYYGIGIYKVSGNQISKTDFSLKGETQNNVQKPISYDLYNHGRFTGGVSGTYNSFSFNGDKLIISVRNRNPHNLYIINLLKGVNLNEKNSEPEERVKLSDYKSQFIFFHYDKYHNRILYQKITDDVPSNLFIHELDPVKNKMEEELTVKSKIKLNVIDSILLADYQDAMSNFDDLPFETQAEKRSRLVNTYKIYNKKLIIKKDSLINILFSELNAKKTVIDSDKKSIFKLENYNPNTETWLFKFPGLNANYGFSLSYKQAKNIAQTHFKNDFKKIKIQVYYYFDLLTQRLEPLKVYIDDSMTNVNKTIYINANNIQINKNICFVNTENLKNFSNENIQDIFSNVYQRDDDVLNKFINIGKPKRIFNFSKFNISDFDNSPIEAIDLSNEKWSYKFSPFPISYDNFTERNLKNPFKFDILNEYIKVQTEYSNDSLNLISTSTNELVSILELQNWDWDSSVSLNDYFIKSKIEFDNSNWKFNELKLLLYSQNNLFKELDLIELGFDRGFNRYPYHRDRDMAKFNGITKWTSDELRNNNLSFEFSPNLKFFAIRVEQELFVYETSSWKLKYKLKNTSGNIYWDSNSIYLGVGQILIPFKTICDSN
jgi:hypothetical protein